MKLTLSNVYASLLTVAFVVLKLCGVIAWSWWWVVSPTWIEIIIHILAQRFVKWLGKRADRYADDLFDKKENEE